MSKLFKVIKAILKFLYSVLDRLIVTPLSKLIYIINDKIKQNSGRFEKIINKPYMLIYLSLAFAVGIFLLVDNKVINLIQTEAEILSNQKVEVLYNQEAYVIEGIPESVDITLIGRKSDLYLAKQLGEHQVVLDLTEYGEGTHKVRLTYNQTVDSLSYKLDPGSVTVNIKKKVSQLKTISYELLNEDKLLETISVKSVELSKTEVVVKGSIDNLNKIAIVKALVDLNNPKFIESGKFNLDNVPLVAYDEYGSVLSDVEIVHGIVTASLELSSYSVEVPIRVETTGELKIGRAISTITVNGKDVYKVTIYGDEEALNNIEYIPVTIDINGEGTTAKSYNVTLNKPAGVRHISESTATINLTFDAESQKTIDDVRVEKENVSSKLEANTKPGVSPTVSIQVKGVSSVIDKIDASSIIARVNLANYDVGSYEVVVEVVGDDPRVTYLALQTLKIDITAKK